MALHKPHFRHRDEAMPMRVGAFEFTKTGASRFDLRDPYHLAVTLRWPEFFVALFLLDLLINLVFAALYWAEPGSIANATPSFVEAFFFSNETLATVGYGVMAPATLYGHIVSSVEILCGMTFTALVTGLIFVRFSKPRAKFRFAEVAVVTTYNGKPTLMIRVGNGRLTLLADAQARVTCIMREESSEGHVMRRAMELPLVRAKQSIFALTWNLMHEIDEASPLFGITGETVLDSDLRLLVFLEARDHALGATVHDMRDYTPQQVLYGTRYQDAITVDDQGRTNVDLNRISAVEPDLPDGRVPSYLN
jgi:inward rectifier potassium channel